MNGFILLLAQGFGSGRIPVGPGTWGSVVGLAWFTAMLATGSPLLFLILGIGSIPFSAWICGAGEKILREKDPGSIVLDEIIAVPLCFVTWITVLYTRSKVLPAPEYFFSGSKWSMLLGVFVLFRIFDVAKPWPVRQSQSLPGGWGVTADDVLAAIYVNVVTLTAWWVWPDWF